MRGPTTRALILAGQLLVLLLTVGMFARPAGRGADQLPTSQISSSDPTDSDETPMRTTQTRSPWKRRIPLVVGSLATIVAMMITTAGVTVARFTTSAAPDTNSFTAGTVTIGTVTTGNATTGSCALPNNWAPSDTQSCTLKATYSGTTSTYLGLDILIATPTGSTPFYDGTSTGLQVTVADDQTHTVSYTAAIPTTSGVCPTSGPYASGYTCYYVKNLLVNTTPLSSTQTTGVNPITFTTTLTVPSTSTNSYWGSTSTVVLTAHVAQSKNNPSTTLTCTAGSTCAQITWS